MGHCIDAIIIKGRYNEKKGLDFDLHGVNMGFDLTMFFIDHYYSAYWQYILKTKGMLDTNGALDMLFPCEYALSVIMEQVCETKLPVFAIISTDYFGGIGNQSANVYIKDKIADKNIKMVNQALAYLGVKREKGFDEFDTIGLSNYRSNPDYLDKYADLIEELGI